MLKLNRHGIYALAVFMYAMIIFGPQLIRYLYKDTCTCYVQGFEHHSAVRRNPGKYSTGSHVVYFSLPIALCKTETVEFIAKARFNEGQALGDPVTVLYAPGNPENAEFLTWRSYWFLYGIIKLVLFGVLTIAAYSFVSKDQFLIIRPKPKQGEKIIELTKREKDLLLAARMKRAREALFRNRRR